MNLSIMQPETPERNSERASMDPKFVVDSYTPRTDFSTYISQFSLQARQKRQLHIGLHSTTLRREALLGAFEEAKKGHDIGTYLQAHEAVTRYCPELDPGNENDWVGRVEAQNKREKARLQSEIKKATQSGIKDSSRILYKELSTFLISTGRYEEAAETLKKQRQLAETEAQIQDVVYSLTSLDIVREQWANAILHATKLENISKEVKGESRERGFQMAAVALGLAYLGQGEFMKSVRAFLNLKPGMGESMNHIMSGNEVAIFGGLCALASMGRNQLQKEVLELSSFRTYLEVEPQVRKAIQAFMQGRYSACIRIIEENKNEYLLNAYLGEKTETLVRWIRNKCIVHYCYPFSVVKLSTLEEQFGVDGQDITEELIALIKGGDLNARIDVMAGTLVSVATSPRVEIQAQTLSTLMSYERELKRRILRMSIINAGLEVQSKKIGRERVTVEDVMGDYGEVQDKGDGMRDFWVSDDEALGTDGDYDN